ncbi:MAG TPA: hypothetical protein VHP33_38645 [Polyangiaceae bacterium]|nr:hypothetical protein [Polyangiaceae bacterium]
MSSRFVVLALLAVVGCKGNDADDVKNPAAADSAAALASSFAQAAAALAQAQAAASAAATPGTPSAAAPAPSAAAAPSASAAADTGFSAAVSNELGRLGFSTAAADLVALGKDRGVLLSGLGRLAGHPTALSAIFNSDKVTSSFTKRPEIQAACSDPEKLKPLLLYVLGSPAARQWVADPASIKAFTGSKLGLQLQACPAFKTLVQQPKMLATLTKDNAAASAVVTNPNFRAELDRLKIRQDATLGKVFSRK